MTTAGIGAQRNGPPGLRTVVITVVTLVLVAGGLLVGPFERISGADLEQIRAARWRLELACEPDAAADEMSRAADVLVFYFGRAPHQNLPLAGGGGITTMVDVLGELRWILVNRIVPGIHPGGDPAPPGSPCDGFAEPIAARFGELLANAREP